MLDKLELRAAIVRRGMTQKALAKQLGISPRTFSNKLKKGVFGSDEIERMIEVLGITNPMDIFFAAQ